MGNYLYHKSPEVIEKITSTGLFESWLFFGTAPSHRGRVTYKIEVDDEDIIDAQGFFFLDDCWKLSDLVEEVMERCAVDEDTAQELIAQRETVDDAETDWWLQLMTAKAAKILGYRCVAVPDEYGTSYMCDMMGREEDLVLVDRD